MHDHHALSGCGLCMFAQKRSKHKIYVTWQKHDVIPTVTGMLGYTL